MAECTMIGSRADRILGMTAAAFAASAGAGLVGDVSTVSADIVYSGPVNIAIPDNIDGLYMNVVTGETGSSAGAVAGWDINPYSAGAVGTSFNLWGATTATWLSPSGLIGGPYPLTLGTLVDGTGTFTRPGGGTNVGAQVTLNAPNYFGFQFANEAAGGANNFGWIEITFGANAGTRAITGYAYENSGAGITVGAVPEPSSLGLLALGAVGLVARRRRRAA